MGGQVRLQKFLSAAGVASRRKSEVLITDGRVTVNGDTVTELGTKVDPESDVVTVDGARVVQSAPIYLVMNKPRATVCTESDPEGRERVHDLLPPGLPRLFTVGRLDYDTEGALLMTNDGTLAHRLPQSALTLNNDGKLGVRVVDWEGIVQFMPVKILRDDIDGIWVTGLTEEADVIVVGQDFVTAGLKVAVTYEAESDGEDQP